jgi:multisubunit Na+/H+ antiporter MnhG subunit
VSRRAVDRTSLVAGIAIAVLGALLLLDEQDAIHLGFAFLAPAVTATVGAILLASGLSRAGRR